MPKNFGWDQGGGALFFYGSCFFEVAEWVVRLRRELFWLVTLAGNKISKINYFHERQRVFISRTTCEPIPVRNYFIPLVLSFTFDGELAGGGLYQIGSWPLFPPLSATRFAIMPVGSFQLRSGYRN